MNSKISDKDKKDWENFISSKDKLLNKDNFNNLKKIIKIKTLDLHGFSLEQANQKINDYIHECFSKGIEKLVVVTGKGIHSQNEKDPYVSKELGILRYSVPEYIKKNKELMSLIKDISQAKIEDGGDGAFYIYLRKQR